MPEHPGIGIGGYDLRSRSDQAFAFDYDHSGRPDHLALYRPGSGGISFVKNSGGTFISTYGGVGLGRYDLKSTTDRVIAFDFDHSGRQDHLALYRLDAGIVAVLRNDGDGIFTPVYERPAGNPGAAARDAPPAQYLLLITITAAGWIIWCSIAPALGPWRFSRTSEAPLRMCARKALRRREPASTT
jgi:hypothetical protein